MFSHDFFIKFKNANNGNYNTLSMLLFSYISKFKFQKIFNFLKTRFEAEIN
jgi:hypothetical protein